MSDFSVNFISLINQIDLEDLQYIERDLCFYELVSLGFLLFGAEHSNAEFILQKLLVLANNRNAVEAQHQVGEHKGKTVPVVEILNSDLLRQYASINQKNWRPFLLEALSIIGARRVLDKLGFEWDELHQHYLPHIAALSLHVHPLLKALYKICERMKPSQAKCLVQKVYEQRQLPAADKLQFNDYAFMEIFMLDWLTRHIISVGDQKTNMANVEVLLEYFKFNEMDALKSLLVDTISTNTNSHHPETTVEPNVEQCDSNRININNDQLPIEQASSLETVQNISGDDVNGNNATSRSFAVQELACALPPSDCYTVRLQSAGFILIINQREFKNETDTDLQYLLPKLKLGDRVGTDVDKQRLVEVFSTFGYIPHEYENLDHSEMLHCIRETVKRSCIYDSLVVCILSHGMDGAVYGSNSIPVKIAEIEEIITSGGMLQGKPKMLIIQACQKDEGLDLVSSKNTKTPTADTYVDVIKAMSTVPGYSSVRHTTTGTWFIQALCDAVHKLGDNKHMLDVLTAVTREVTKKRGDKNEVMVPQTSFTLRKHFYLPRRY